MPVSWKTGRCNWKNGGADEVGRVFFWRAYDFVRLLLLYDPCGENMNKVFGPFDETACRRPP